MAPTSVTLTSLDSTTRKTTGTTYQTTATTTTQISYKPTSTSTTTNAKTPVQYFPTDVESENPSLESATDIKDRYSNSNWALIKQSVLNNTKKQANHSNDYFSLLKPAQIYPSSTGREEEFVEKLSFEDSINPFEKFLETIRFKATSDPPSSTTQTNEASKESLTTVLSSMIINSLIFSFWEGV